MLDIGSISKSWNETLMQEYSDVAKLVTLIEALCAARSGVAAKTSVAAKTVGAVSERLASILGPPFVKGACLTAAMAGCSTT